MSLCSLRLPSHIPLTSLPEEGEKDQDSLIPMGQAEKEMDTSTSKEECLIPQHPAKSLLLQKMVTQLLPRHMTRKLMKFQSSPLKPAPRLSHTRGMPWSISLRHSLVTHGALIDFLESASKGIITSRKIKLGRRGQPASLLGDLKVGNKGGSGFNPTVGLYAANCLVLRDAALAGCNYQPTPWFFVSAQPGY